MKGEEEQRELIGTELNGRSCCSVYCIRVPLFGLRGGRTALAGLLGERIFVWLVRIYVWLVWISVWLAWISVWLVWIGFSGGHPGGSRGQGERGGEGERTATRRRLVVSESVEVARKGEEDECIRLRRCGAQILGNCSSFQSHSACTILVPYLCYECISWCDTCALRAVAVTRSLVSQ